MAIIDKLHRISFSQADWMPYINGVIDFYKVIIERIESKISSEGFRKNDALSSNTSYIYTQDDDSIIENIQLTLTINSSLNLITDVKTYFKLKGNSSTFDVETLGPWVVDYAVNVFKYTKSGTPFESNTLYVKWSNLNDDTIESGLSSSPNAARFIENKTYIYAMPYLVINSSNNSQYLKNALVIDANTYYGKNYGNMHLYDIYEIDNVKYRPIKVDGGYIILYPIYVL